MYQIDAFTDKVFGGNPACVVPLKEWLPDDLLLKIARENAVSETAFFVENKNTLGLRWFTPEIEMDLCGHATLATAHVLKTILDYPSDKMIFETQSGELIVTVDKDLITMDFPSRKPVPAELPKLIREALSIQPSDVLKSRDYVLVYQQEQDIRNIEIDKHLFDQINLDPGGVIITARGEQYDFVSRFFTPQASILEDPVTGSAHCSLIPYWSEQLHKKEMVALQLSERQGKLFCADKGRRVLISGTAKTYLKGTIMLD
ncbi:PhzF family phenazine biosynthesis protein [Cesiribacter sp. SM1]|uniref:PhzF family phenazine biosynthesis protein n=1 Tax=Cesiribacter sp. SM1 TaxID=2861196 RepID=UPI0021075E0E|nr:PhzF family phenazine biosynthesis protein [Cesiribacter sp. SM1]